MSLAWGGHQNGRIPLSQLSPIGKGQLPGGMQFGKQQYVHPVVARAWAALVRAVHAETGVRLKVTEGYRDFALQQHYWNTLPFPQAATPGTSSHGWARAVDMYGYTVRALQAVRAIGPRYGWSLATGDRVGEPWHIEYVASLTSPPSFADDGTTTPITPTPRRDEEMLVFIQVRGESAVRVIGGGYDYQFASAAELDSFRNVLTSSGYRVPAVVEVPSTFALNLFRRAVVNPTVPTAGQNATAVDTALAPRFEAIPGGTSGGGFTAADRQRLQAVPTAEQNGQAARTAIVR